MENMDVDWQSPLLCSIDAEFTGFDIEKDEVIELGLVFFRLIKDDIIIEHEWTRVFKPSQNVKIRVRSLTGISDEELQTAKPISESITEIKSLLQDCTLVGHNLIVDMKFIETLGIRWSKQKIDTLELVQFVLPTYHSYNLEHLTHALHIQEENQHRALLDARATAKLLLNLLQIFNGYGKDIKKRAMEIAKTTAWGEPLSWPIHGEKPMAISLDDKYTDSAQTLAAYDTAIQNTPSVLVVESKNFILNAWQKHDLVFSLSPKATFSPIKLKSFLDRADLSSTEILVALKLLVWASTNWQTKTPADLNLSFSGQGAGRLITGTGQDWSEETEAVVAMDYKSMLEAIKQNIYEKRTWVFDDLEKIEEFLTHEAETSVSWQGLTRTIKETFYDDTPVLEKLMAATDLFFAVLALELKRYSWIGKEIPVLELDSPTVSGLKNAAETLADTIYKASPKEENKRLKAAADTLNSFFTNNPSIAAWIEVSDIRYRLILRPILPSKLVIQRILAGNFIALIPGSSERVSKYITARLSMENFHQTITSQTTELVKPTILTQAETVMEDLCLSNTPSIIIVGSHEDAIKFYETYGLILREKTALFLHRYSGGLGKTMKNFGLRENSVLIATPETLSQSPVILTAKTLIYLNNTRPTELTKAYEKLVAKNMGISESEALLIQYERTHLRVLGNIVLEKVKNLLIISNNAPKDPFSEILEALIRNPRRLIHKSKTSWV